MSAWRSLQRRLDARVAIVALGGFYIALGLWMAVTSLSDSGSVVTVLVIFSFVGGTGVVLAVGGYRLPQTEIDPAFYVVVLRRTLAGIGVILTVLALYNLQPDAGITNPTRSVPILTGFSAVAGFAVGLPDARARTRTAELERKNELLQRVHTQLEESNERLEQFAYGASHDLQEPLRMVSSYLQLIDARYGDDFDEDGEEFLEYAVDGADRMREMIDGLLEFSRVDTHGSDFEPVALADVLADVRKDLKRRIDETGATVTVEPLPRVEGDRTQLRRLFQNLLSNAIEYSGDEPPEIDIFAEQDGDEWVVSVRDAGIGIAEKDRDRIFEVFQHLHSQDEHSGTGIGLALCERIAERHGGTIRVDSEPGVGSTFSVRLPAADERASVRSANSGAMSR